MLENWREMSLWYSSWQYSVGLRGQYALHATTDMPLMVRLYWKLYLPFPITGLIAPNSHSNVALAPSVAFDEKLALAMNCADATERSTKQYCILIAFSQQGWKDSMRKIQANIMEIAECLQKKVILAHLPQMLVWFRT